MEEGWAHYPSHTHVVTPFVVILVDKWFVNFQLNWKMHKLQRYLLWPLQHCSGGGTWHVKKIYTGKISFLFWVPWITPNDILNNSVFEEMSENWYRMAKMTNLGREVISPLDRVPAWLESHFKWHFQEQVGWGTWLLSPSPSGDQSLVW